MSANDFSGFPLAVGEIFGLRVWLMDDYGRLRARHVDCPPWRPGVNVAACHAATHDPYHRATTFVRAFYANPNQPPQYHGAALEPLARPERHAAPDERCKCGFYAYTTPGPETYADEGAVVGIVRATGRTLIGAKGFRCEKAEIVALLDPAAAAPGDYMGRWRADRLRLVYPAVPLLPDRDALLRFAPIESTAPEPSDDEFWRLP